MPERSQRSATAPRSQSGLKRGPLCPASPSRWRSLSDRSMIWPRGSGGGRRGDPPSQRSGMQKPYGPRAPSVKRAQLARRRARHHNAGAEEEPMERIELSRDVQAVQIPAGHTTLLERGTEAYITQSLGGSYTLQVPEYGGLFRIAGRDGD